MAMAKPWYFQMMGAEIGPLTAAELRDRVKLGQIQPDTLVRSGKDGKWIPADRWKGLLPAKEAVSESSATEETAAAATEQPASAAAPAGGASPGGDDDEMIYHLQGEVDHGAVPYSEPDEYDFFQFVGFRHAITPKLYDAVVAYSNQHRMTLTKITRRGIAQFIGRPELGEDKPPAPPSEAQGSAATAEEPVAERPAAPEAASAK
jgi:hypothetical protein